MEQPSRFNRRSFLASISALTLGSLAGCSSDEGSGSSGSTATPEPTATETPTDTETPTETATETETPTPEPHTELVLESPEIVTIERSYGDDVGGEVAIVNNGDTATGAFGVGLDWLDGSGEYLATSDIQGIYLEPGETWVARQPAFLAVDDPSQVESVEATVTEERSPARYTFNPDGIEVADETIRSSNEDLVARGTINNDRSTSEYINVAAKVYDQDDNVLGMAWTINEVASGDSWRFETNPQTFGRNGQVESGEVIPYLEG